MKLIYKTELKFIKRINEINLFNQKINIFLNLIFLFDINIK